jgi:hypothetical protein
MKRSCSSQQEIYSVGSFRATVSRMVSRSSVSFDRMALDGMMLLLFINRLGLHGAAKHLESDPAYTHSRIELAAKRKRGRRSLVNTAFRLSRAHTKTQRGALPWKVNLVKVRAGGEAALYAHGLNE